VSSHFLVRRIGRFARICSDPLNHDHATAASGSFIERQTHFVREFLASSDFDSLIEALQAFTDLAPSLESRTRELLVVAIDSLTSVLELGTEVVGVDLK
jgi:hypothetical protein